MPANTEEPLLDCWNRIGVIGSGKPSCPELAEVSHCRNCLVYIRAGRHKLDQPVPDSYDMEWVNVWLEQHDDRRAQQRLLVFHLGQDDYFALPLTQVVEVLPMRTPSPIPHTNHTVLRGLTHVRGELCLHISLCGLLSRPPITLRDNSTRARLICVSVGGCPTVFAAEAIHGIAESPAASLQPLPDSLPLRLRELSQGMTLLTLDGREQHTCVLDTRRWLEIMERLH